MLNRLILFLIRLKLGVKKNERFQFTNQASRYNKYYINDRCIMKVSYDKYATERITKSNVKLNWLLNDKCKIKKVD